MSSYAFHLKQHSSVFVYSVHRSSRTYSTKHSIPGEENKHTAHVLKKRKPFEDLEELAEQTGTNYDTVNKK